MIGQSSHGGRSALKPRPAPGYFVVNVQSKVSVSVPRVPTICTWYFVCVVSGSSA
jgi:hypothetical protein